MNNKLKTKGQVTIEYAVMFMAIVAAVIIASQQIMRPAVTRFFGASEQVLNSAIEEVVDTF